MAVKDGENGSKIVLYSTGCPKCKVLEAKLNNKHISYETITNENEMIQNGFMSLPVLKVNEDFFSFKDANDWINAVGGN